MENKNTFIAIALMLLVWVAFNIMFPPVKTVAPPEVAKQELTQEVASSPAGVLPPPNVTINDTAMIAPSEKAAELRDIIVDSPLYRAVISTAGGQLKEFRLKNYRELSSGDSPLVEMVTSHDGTLRLTGEGDFAFPADARFYYDLESSKIELGPEQSTTVKLRLPLASGLQLIREYRFSAKDYTIGLSVSLHNPGENAKSGRLSLILQETIDKIRDGGGSNDFAGSVTYDGKKVHSDKTTALEKGEKEYSSPVWSAFKSKYFLRALLPEQSAAAAVTVKKAGNHVSHTFQTEQFSLAAGAKSDKSFLLFLGPMEMQALEVVGHDLEKAVDLGWFAIFGQPLFLFLKFIYGFVGNYGWAIIILTIIIKLCFWPLTNKSYASMKAMQKLQPQMQNLREKFKNDRDRMNQEIMLLYKNHRVNPLGGCLPMLVQFPIFIALYNVLMNMIELRHAPFMLWITDLSVKDPYYITPLVMGATMFLQQKLTPSQLDPIQQKIFLIMPVVFTFLFLTFPSGLVIYWLVNNVLSIMQQVMINRRKD